MASRRGRHHGAPITLFSFQDIILCVTGILILITLLLALELVTRIDVGQRPSVDVADVATLERRITTAEEEQTQLLAEVRELDQLISQTAETPLTPLAGSIEELRGAVMARRAANDQARANLGTLKGNIETEQQQAEILQEQVSTMLAEIRRDAASTAAAVAALDEQAQENRLRFLPGEGDGKQPLIVECDARQIRMGRPNERGELIEMAAWQGFAAARELNNWATRRDRQREYFVLFTRPDGVANYERAKRDLEALGFDVGWDAVPSDVDLFATRKPSEGH